jgi:hypothetical protein
MGGSALLTNLYLFVSCKSCGYIFARIYCKEQFILKHFFHKFLSFKFFKYGSLTNYGNYNEKDKNNVLPIGL